jgi:hypothetical protein
MLSKDEERKLKSKAAQNNVNMTFVIESLIRSMPKRIDIQDLDKAEVSLAFNLRLEDYEKIVARSKAMKLSKGKLLRQQINTLEDPQDTAKQYYDKTIKTTISQNQLARLRKKTSNLSQYVRVNFFEELDQLQIVPGNDREKYSHITLISVSADFKQRFKETAKELGVKEAVLLRSYLLYTLGGKDYATAINQSDS